MQKDEQIRNSFAEWSVENGTEFQIELYEKWEEYRVDFFENASMVKPVIELLPPGRPITYGCYWPKNPSGLSGQILLRPSLYWGTHPDINAEAPIEGRVRFIQDVLLHEMVHQYQFEIINKPDASYGGHGPAFRDQCNRIGKILGLAKVRTCKMRGADRELPSCSQWPHNVRGSDYYLGAYIREERFNQESDRTVTISIPARLKDKVKQFIKTETDQVA